jgi:hypothetical protein
MVGSELKTLGGTYEGCLGSKFKIAARLDDARPDYSAPSSASKTVTASLSVH